MLVSASERLTSNGYSVVSLNESGEYPHQHMRMFEDDYGVVLIDGFDSVETLLSEWTEAQATLVKSLSTSLTLDSDRGWEGYLVLFTPQRPTSDDMRQLSEIRYNTTRTRKLVITGEEDMIRGLEPLLPLPIGSSAAFTEEPLGELAREIVDQGIPSDEAESLLSAYKAGKSLMEAISFTLLSKQAKIETKDS
jgi:hypothetical protein